MEVVGMTAHATVGELRREFRALAQFGIVTDQEAVVHLALDVLNILERFSPAVIHDEAHRFRALRDMAACVLEERGHA
jgi:hypothetical protein